MSSIYAIVTHHRCIHHTLDDAADAWKLNEVCAIGWSDWGNLKKTKRKLKKDMRDFLEIEKDDIILAYANNNRIAQVGVVADGKYDHTRKNEVGRDERLDGFDYPNQYRVRWWDEPYDFSRNDLPDYLRKQFGKRGRTVTRLDLSRYGISFREAVKIIKTNSRSGS